jgi:hypothetical protein
MAKATKLRPYKVDYIEISEIVDGKAPVHFRLVRVPTASEAEDVVLQAASEGSRRVIISARRFYKKLPKEKSKLVALDTLFDEAYLSAVNWLIPVTTPSPIKDSTTEALLADLAGWDAHDKHEQLMDTFVQTPTTDPAPRMNRFPIPAVQTQQDAPVDTPVPCPTCGQGMDTDGDGNCSACAFAAQTPMNLGRWLFPVITIGTFLLLVGLYLYQHSAR